MNIELLRKLKTLENPNQVDEIKGNEKVLFDKRKNIIAIVGYPKTIQFDKVVKFNTNDWEYLDEQGVREYLATKGINLDEVESHIETTEEPINDILEELEKREPIGFDNHFKGTRGIDRNQSIEDAIKESKEETITPKKKSGRPAKK